MLDGSIRFARTLLAMDAAFLLASCATTPEIASDYDRSVTFATANADPWVLGGPYWGSNIDVRQYREGTLAIDVFDGHTHRPVWHGWAQKELTRKDLEQPAEPISKAVNSVLARFPPARDSNCHERGSECVS